MNEPVVSDDNVLDAAPGQFLSCQRDGPSTPHDDEPPELGLRADIARVGSSVTVLSLAGAIDRSGAELFSTAVYGGLSAGAGGRVVLELNRVTSLSGHGLGILVEAQRHARRCRTELVVVVDQVAPAARSLEFAPADARPVVYSALTAAVQMAREGDA